jgi:hypothetical protein
VLVAVLRGLRRQLPDDRDHLGEPPHRDGSDRSRGPHLPDDHRRLPDGRRVHPFPTRLVAENIRGDGARAAAIAYGITLTLTAALFNAIWFYAARGGRLLRPDADPETVRGISKTLVFGPWLYLALTAVAAIDPVAGAIGFGVFALFWVIESSVFGRDRPHRSAER